MDNFKLAQEYKRLTLFNEHDPKIKNAYHSLYIWFTYNKQIPENVTVEEFATLSKDAKEVLLEALQLPQELRKHSLPLNIKYLSFT